MNRRPPSRKRRLSASAAILAGALSCVCAGWVIAARQDGRLARALRSPLGIYAGIVFLACAVLLCLLGGVLWRVGRRRDRRDGTAGTATIEFVLLFPIALCIVLVMVQSMLVVTGNIVVHYGAYAAARAAVVWVPERVSYEEPRNVVTDSSYSTKMHRIRSAAVEVVKAVSSGKKGAGGTGTTAGTAVLQDGLDRFFSLYGRTAPKWVHSILPAKYEYAWNHTEVALKAPESDGKYTDHEDLTVSIRHMLYLSVPYAKRLFGKALSTGQGDYAAEAVATYTLTNQGVEDEIDVEVFPRYVGRGEE